MDVKTLCLGTLTMKEATGYEIKKVFEEGFQFFYRAGFGSIYPALAQLEADGLVTCREEADNGRPPKKIYAITDAGRRALDDDLRKAPVRHLLRSEFLVLLFFSHFLTPERLKEVLDSQSHQFKELLHMMQNECCDEPSTPGIDFIRGFAHTMLTTAATYIDTHGPQLQRDHAKLTKKG